MIVFVIVKFEKSHIAQRCNQLIFKCYELSYTSINKNYIEIITMSPPNVYTRKCNNNNNTQNLYSGLYNL